MNATRSTVPTRSLLVLAACALLVLAFAPAQYFGRQQDDALYLIGARALVSGRYCLLTSPGCPPLTMINPGWPALLAPVALFTENPAPYQIYSALLLAAVPAALWFWLRRRSDETTALLAAALLASSPLVLAQSGVVMSEAPFTLALLGLLAAAESGRAALAGAAAAALLLIRTAGVSALPALAPFFRRRGRSGLPLAAAPPALAAALWAAWSWSKTGSIGKFELLPSTYGGGSWLKPLAVAASNARYYAGEWGGSFAPPRWAGGAAAAVLGAALAAAALRGVWLSLRRRADEPAAWALLGSAAMLALWGWQYERYMIPLLPLLLWALAAGLGRAAKPALGALLVLQLGAQTVPRLGRPSPWAAPELARTYAWLAARPRPALLSSAQPVRDGWLSGMPGVALPDTVNSAEFASALKTERVGYVLRADGQDYGLNADPGAALRLHEERAFAHLDDAALFRKIHEEPAERAAVYEPR